MIKFIEDNCKQIKAKNPGYLGSRDTGLSSSMFTVKELLNSKNQMDCAQLTYSKIDPVAAVYVFINKVTHRRYGGSSIYLPTRVRTYQQS